MRSSRVEAFTDGVVAILITIMVLDLPRPAGSSLGSLLRELPVLAAYLLSFLYLAICWNNHHHMFQASSRVDGAVLWANLHLLLWLSLVPFATGWMSDQRFSPVPTTAYGCVLLAAACAFWMLQTALVHADGAGSRLAAAVGHDLKGKITVAALGAATATAAALPALGLAAIAVVLVTWAVPDRRVERSLSRTPRPGDRPPVAVSVIRGAGIPERGHPGGSPAGGGDAARRARAM